ncbi:hypothetical protein L7F22_059147 [Adiantum nelumboides]|nr:hypothetical protein [Adiantum nelumboides]
MGLAKRMAFGAVMAAAGVAAMPLLMPAAVEMVGFSEHGIDAGSWAAAWMRSYGGKVPAESLCAMLQRVGARGGLEASTIAMAEGAAVALAGLAAFLFKRAEGSEAAAGEPAYELIEGDDEEAGADAAESARFSLPSEEEEEGDGDERAISNLSSSPVEMEEWPPADPPSTAAPASNMSANDDEDPSMLLNPFAPHCETPPSCSCNTCSPFPRAKFPAVSANIVSINIIFNNLVASSVIIVLAEPLAVADGV